jgi:phosphoribosylformimino-5-aminoimidazole carboxamide ribotide isomerase
MTPPRLAGEMKALGVAILVCTDVSRDGMLQGPNLDLLNEVLEVGPRQLIASGGVSSVADLQQLKTLEPRGLIGAIVGKALYEGAIDLGEAMKSIGPV